MLPEGNVEVWLGEVERRMKASVRTQVIAAMHAHASRPRTSWVREWPAMVVLAVSQIFWARVVEDAITSGTTEVGGRVGVCCGWSPTCAWQAGPGC
jgi:dynein heavy chain